MIKFFKYKTNLFLLGVIVFIIFSCANRGQGPQGGPKDEVPPKPVMSTPGNRETNVTKSKITIEFDENINVKDVAKNVIISPPQLTSPDIRSYAKKLVVNLNDTLLENTTYSIDFGDAIVDNNEGNVLKGYVFSFATGNEIDTLQMSGTLLNAEDLNPLKGVVVGVHSDLSDSAFVTKRFVRVTKSGDDGKFTISNLHQNNFAVYALNDLNKDYIFQKGEGAAFLDTTYLPTFENYIRQDTIWKDSLTVDTIKSVDAIRYLPNNIVLRYFKDDFKRQYLVKSERSEPHKINFYFNAKNDSLPHIRPLNVEWSEKMVLQKSQGLDSLSIWLTDSTLIKKDTIQLEVNYWKTDSILNLEAVTDTINLFMRKKGKQSVEKAEKKEETKFLNISTNLSSSFDIYKQGFINFDVPIKQYDVAKIHLSQKVDTAFVSKEFVLEKNDSIGMSYRVNLDLKPETSYRLEVDSAAFVSVYGLHNDKLSSDFAIKSLEEYATLLLTLVPQDSTAVFQIINKEDKVVRTVPIAKGEAITKIKYLEPGDYYVRMFLDKNGNGKWDTGNVFEKRHPEEVFYCPKKLTLIKNWEFEETWDYLSIPLLEQKAVDLRKTKELNKSEE